MDAAVSAARRIRPYRLAGAARLSGVLLTCEHASRELPLPYGRGLACARLLRSHWGWDPGAWAVTVALARSLGACAVGGRWSRLWVDLNRAPGDPTCVPERVNGVVLPWNRRLAAGQLEARLRRYYLPYHARIDRELARHVAHGLRPTVLAIHSFTPRLGRERRDFDAGVLHTLHDALARRFARALATQGLRVRLNEPYSGKAGMMYAAQRHGTAYTLPCLELELNQALLARRSAEEVADCVARGWRAAAQPSRAGA